MGNNHCQGQLVGPFIANEEIYKVIVSASASSIKYVSNIGIQTEPGNSIFINDKEILIGNTGIYEIGNTEIKSIKFKQDVDNNTIIDYKIKIK